MCVVISIVKELILTTMYALLYTLCTDKLLFIYNINDVSLLIIHIYPLLASKQRQLHLVGHSECKAGPFSLWYIYMTGENWGVYMGKIYKLSFEVWCFESKILMHCTCTYVYSIAVYLFGCTLITSHSTSEMCQCRSVRVALKRGWYSQRNTMS